MSVQGSISVTKLARLDLERRYLDLSEETAHWKSLFEQNHQQLSQLIERNNAAPDCSKSHPKTSPSLNELLGNIDAIASKHLTNFGLKNRITSAKAVDSSQMANLIANSEQTTDYRSTQQTLPAAKPKPQIVFSKMQQSSPEKSYNSTEEKIRCLFKENSQSRSKNSYSITISKMIHSAENEEEVRESDSKGPVSNSKCTAEVRPYCFSGLQITPDKSNLFQIRGLSPINENYDKLFNSTQFLSPASSLDSPSQFKNIHGQECGEDLEHEEERRIEQRLFEQENLQRAKRELS